ncbi:MAG TPA: polysaccharide deacetylase family protein [Polyangiaceae bacterium]|nr:polysaccharide deacetylase family protein [Polyangiaceae bacterium]
MTRRFFLWAGSVSFVLQATGAHAEPAESCSLPADGKYPGLYSSDAWPRGEVVLTFDDGPHPGATPRVLNALAERGMVATFFVVGRAINARTYPIIQRMVAEGHSIGTHTYNHDLEMTTRHDGAVEYISGQYAVARLCVEIALLAQSPAHFDELHRAVFGHDSQRHLSSSSLGKRWREYEQNHRRLLTELGYADGERPYPMLFARPPGGIPYLGSWKNPVFLQQHETALQQLGLLNILWHGGSGDTVPEKKRDFGFLVSNLRYHSRRGGILLIHDQMRHDALRAALARMATDPDIRVVPLLDAVERKFACTGVELSAALPSFT